MYTFFQSLVAKLDEIDVDEEEPFFHLALAITDAYRDKTNVENHLADLKRAFDNVDTGGSPTDNPGDVSDLSFHNERNGLWRKHISACQLDQGIFDT